MKTIQEVNQAIMFGTWTNVELASMIDAVKWNRAQLTKNVKNSIKPGQMVRFTSSKTGQTILGKVRKIAIKFVTVDTGQTLWKVPANMLEAV
jgi:hypothetical protein